MPPPPRFNISDAAMRDLEQITDYIAVSSPQNAAAFLDHFLQACESLSEMPGLGHTREELASNLRVWNIDSFLILYRPDTKPLSVARVISGYRDLNRLNL